MKNIVLLFMLLLGNIASAQGGPSILREGYDNSGTVSNLTENILTPVLVSSGKFGKVFSQPVDGAIYAQPLYIPNITVNSAARNVVYVATMNDTVYAFDADTNVPPLWTANLKPTGATAVPSTDGNVTDTFGVLSTPVIDPTNSTLFAVAYTSETGGTVYRLHALDITTGAEKFGGPVVLSTPGFVNVQQMQRPGLVISGGNVFIAFGSFGDTEPYNGYVMTYADAPGLAQTGVFHVTPTGGEGAIWQAGRAPVVDASGNVLYMTANGTFDNASNFGESFIRLNPNLTIEDWWAPEEYAYLTANDLDLGVSGPMLIPNTTLIVGGGKEGKLYVLNAENLGHEATGDPSLLQTIQLSGGIFPGPAYYNRTDSIGPRLYIWPGKGGSGVLNAYHFNGTTFDSTPAALGTVTSQSGAFSAAIAVSANGNSNGIVWASMPGTPGGGTSGVNGGILRAFDAQTLTELWNSNTNPNDAVGLWSKFRSPVVANGKVYIGSVTNLNQGGVQPITASLSVYGLLTPSVSGNAATFIGTNTSLGGSWIGTFGTDGNVIAILTANAPSYAAVIANGGSGTWTWANPTTDTRGLQIPPSGSQRLAAAWYGTDVINISFSDGNTHKVTLYAADWDSKGRAEKFVITDQATGNVLDIETSSGFVNGEYLSWNITGSVVITVTSTAGPNAVVNGIFFDTTSSGGNPQITLTWPAITGATGYSVLRATTATGPFTVEGTSTTNNFTDTVPHGSTYYYQIVPSVTTQ